MQKGHALVGRISEWGQGREVGPWLGSSDGLRLPGMQGRGGSSAESPRQRVIYLGSSRRGVVGLGEGKGSNPMDSK